MKSVNETTAKTTPKPQTPPIEIIDKIVFAEKNRANELLNPARRKGRVWTPEQKAAQAEKVKNWKPWKKSTGPRTALGKAKASYNAYKHGFRSAAGKKFDRAIAAHNRFLRDCLRVHGFSIRNLPPIPVIPLKNGIHSDYPMDSGFRRNDDNIFNKEVLPVLRASSRPSRETQNLSTNRHTPLSTHSPTCYQGLLFSRTRQNQELKMPKVLISDKMNKLAEDIFKAKGVTVDVKTGLKPDELKSIIGEYDGLAIRSSTTVTPEILAAATNLKVIGRAGIGVDNVDIKDATARGVIVMNTPFGNSITTAEHAIAMMFALARDIPQASASTHEGKWEKNKFMGAELFSKTLGVIGCGNIGGIVADRAVGLKMNVLAYDPFLSDERAVELGVKKVELDELFAQADFITLHVPKNDKTKGMINKDSIAKMKKGVRIINCARGGLIIESDLKDALDAGHVAGAALDVFDVEPATKDTTPLLGHEKVICTPHLGASTDEAQVNVAIQVAEQMADFLMSGAITNALNMPSISAEDAPRLKFYMKLAEQLGSFAGQITEEAIKKIDISFEGSVTELNVKPLVQVLVAYLLKPQMETVNMVNAMAIAQSRGVQVTESRAATSKEHRSLIAVTVETEKGSRQISGTLFTGREPRIVNIEGVPIEAALTKDMLFIRNADKPGLIGGLGSILGNAGQNIADFRLGRTSGGDSAVCLVSLDAPLPDALFAEVSKLPQVKTGKRLSF